MRLMLPLLALMAMFALPADVFAQATLQPAVTEGDVVAGVGSVTRIDNVAVNNSGAVRVEVDTDNADADADGAVLANGTTLQDREGDSLIAPLGSTIDSFDALTLNNFGESGVNFFLDGTTGIFDDSGIFFGQTLVIQESDVSTASAFSAGTPYIGFFETKFNDARQILIMASVDDPSITSSVDRALVIAQIDSFGALQSETVVVMEGDTLPGQTEAVDDFGTSPHEFGFNNNGETIYIAEMATTDAVYVDLQEVVQEGDPSPVEGRLWESLSAAKVDINDAGDWVVKGNVDGDTSDDDVIVANGDVIAREGTTLPDISPFLITSFGTGPVRISNTGEAVYYATWDDPDTSINEGLFVGQRLIVQKGVSTTGAGALLDIASGQDGFDVSDDGSHIVFEATDANGDDAAIRADLFTLLPPTPGMALVVNDFEVKNAAPSERVYYAYSLTQGTQNVPGCPGLAVGLDNPVLFGSVVANGAGGATLSLFVPNKASGRTVYMQAAQVNSCQVSNRVAYSFP